MSSSKTLWDQLLILSEGIEKQQQISKHESSLQTVLDYAKSVTEGWIRIFPKAWHILVINIYIFFYLGFVLLLKCFV